MTERWFVSLCHAARLTWNRSKKSSSAAMGRVWRPSLGSVYTLLLVTMVYRPWLESLHSVVGYYGLHAFIRVSTLCCWLLQFTGLHWSQYTVVGYCSLQASIGARALLLVTAVYRPPLSSVYCCWLLQFTGLHWGRYTVVGYCSLQASIGAHTLLLVTAVYRPSLGSVYTLLLVTVVWRPSLGSVYTLLLVTAVYRPSLWSVHCS